MAVILVCFDKPECTVFKLCKFSISLKNPFFKIVLNTTYSTHLKCYSSISLGSDILPVVVMAAIV